MSVSDEILSGLAIFRNKLRVVDISVSECTDDLSVIEEALNILKDIPGFNFAAYFKLDTVDFSFKLSKEIVNKDGWDTEQIFQELTAARVIPKVLAENKSTVHTFSKEKSVLAIPVPSQEGVHGIALLSLNSTELLRMVDLELEMLFKYVSEKIKNLALNYSLQILNKANEEAISKATEQFSESSRTLKKIIDLIPVGILLIDEFDGSIADANIKALELIKTNKNKLVGRKRDQLFMSERKIDNENSVIQETETLLKCEDGKVLPIATASSKIHIGNQQFILRSFDDISERKKMEDALLRAHFELEQKVEDRTIELKKANKKLKKEIKKKNKARNAERKLLLSVENSPVGVLITDAKGLIEYANPYFLEQTGYEFEEIKGISPQIFISEENLFDFNTGLLLPLRSERRVEKEVMTKRKNGEKFWATIYGASISNKKDKIRHFTFVQEDISRKKAEEQKLQLAKKKAQESEQFKSNLLNNISHEFRTPLTSVLGFSDLLYQQCESEDLKSLANIIHNSGERLLYTLNNIFYYSEFESDSICINREKTDIVSVSQDSLERLKRWAESKDLKYSFSYSDSQLSAELDRVYFTECLERLFDNAIKFTDSGEIKVDFLLENSSNRDWVVIKITDTGCGMGISEQANIFRPFRQESEGFARKFDGLGLSLVVVNNFIKGMDGKLTIQSEKMKGSTFKLYFPKA